MIHALTRRRLLAMAGIAAGARAQSTVPVRAITRGPKFHWFGYYDKLQLDPSGRYALGMEVDFEHRSPKANDSIKVGMVDLDDGDRWTELGDSCAWNWQQGSMLQWLPGSAREVIWNDRMDGRFVSHILDVKTGKKRTLASSVYSVAPDGRWAITTDFRRLHDTRPGYGYAGLPDPNENVLAPKTSGIWRVDLQTGAQKLIVPVEKVLNVPNPHGDWTGAKHWFNHLLISPDGSRFIFLHRWRGKKEGRSFATRMFTANREGGKLHVIDPYGKTSHFIWRDPQHVLAWAWHPSHGEKFYLYRDQTDKVEVVGPDVMTVNGHCTYLPGNRWILNDTYPDNERNQNVYLYEVATGRRVPLGSFHSPREYTAEWRCDTHPRSSPDGKKIIIDSAHAGNGRQMYLIDIGALV